MTAEGAVATAVGLYLFLRWALRPLAVRLPMGITAAVDIAGALLLVPEYLCTALLRRVLKRAAPLAFVYGEAVSGCAVLVHSLGLALADALNSASARIGHRHAVAGGLVGAVCLVLVS